MMSMLIKMMGASLNLLTRVAPKIAAKQGFKLLCHPFRRKITTKHKLFFSSAFNFHIQYEKETIQAYRWGDGKIKILFLHGWQSHSYLWKAYIESLDHSHYTIYAFDAPGHGQSKGNFLTMPIYSDAIQHVINEIGEVDHIVAHSIGSFATLHALHSNPRISPTSIVLLSSPGSVQDFFISFQEKLKLSAKCIALVNKEFETLVSAPTRSFIAPLYASSVQTKGLLIHDKLDPEISVKHSYEIHEQWKNSILVTTSGLGHNLRSSEVVDLVLQYIRTGKMDEPIATKLVEKGSLLMFNSTTLQT